MYIVTLWFVIQIAMLSIKKKKFFSLIALFDKLEIDKKIK